MHELLRQYVAEKLGEVPAEEEAARDRHCAYYAGFLQQREADLIGWNQKRALAEIGDEIENVRASWDWAVDQGRIKDMDRSLESLAEFYRMRARFREGEEAFARAAHKLARVQSDIDSRPETGRESRIVLGKLLLQQGRFGRSLGLVGKAGELLQESLAIFRDLGARREVAYALCHPRKSVSYQAEDKPLYREALAISKEIGDQRGIALALRGLGWVAVREGAYGAARQQFQESLALSKEVGDQEQIANSLIDLGYISWMLGEYGVAKQVHQESLALNKEVSDQGGIAISLKYLGIDVSGLGEYGEAKQLFQEGLAVYREIGNPWGTASILADLGSVANVLGEHAEAARFARQSLPLAEKCDDQFAIARCFKVLGDAACGLRDLKEAKQYFHRALEMDMALRVVSYALHALVSVARLLAAAGEKERALELLALVFHHPASWQWVKDRAAPLVAQLEAELPPDVVAEAYERGRARDLEATVAELLAELDSDPPQPVR
jgi:tetratricopeptide (TPR) repeat protein